MAQIKVWNTTTHVVMLDGGELLDPQKAAWVDVASNVVQALLASGDVVDTGAKQPEPVAPVNPVQIPSAEEIEALMQPAAKPKSSKSKRNVAEDSEAAPQDEVQLVDESNSEVTDEDSF